MYVFLVAHIVNRINTLQVERIMDVMKAAKVKDGMFPTRWKMNTATPSNGERVVTYVGMSAKLISDQFSVGAFADSAHEYLLKQWLMTSKSESKAKDLCTHLRFCPSSTTHFLPDLEASSAIINHLLYLTPNRQLLYVTDTSGKDVTPSHTFEHLSCFLPGLLALGAHTLPLSDADRELHLWAAQGLAYTCWMTYADHAAGLGPDEMYMQAWKDDPEGHQGRWIEHVRAWQKRGSPGGVPPGLQEVKTEAGARRDYTTRKGAYLLRPETVESFYLLWRLTGDKKWRERGWAVFEAIEREAKTPNGYASVGSVETSPAPQLNEMPR